MKNLWILLLLVLLILPFGCKKTEEEPTGPEVVSFALEQIRDEAKDFYVDGELGRPGKLWADYLIPQFEAENPGVRVFVEGFTITDGTTSNIDLAIASGSCPDVYNGYGGRVSKYANPQYANPLNVDASIYDEFLPGYLENLTFDEKLYGLTTTSWGIGCAVNTDLLAELDMSYIVEQGNWSIDEFLIACGKLKDLGPDYYGTVLFCKTPSGDYSPLTTFSGMGGRLFDLDGNLIVDNEAGIRGMEYLKYLADYEYVPSEPASLSNADLASFWLTGKVLMIPYNLGFSDTWPPEGGFHAVMMPAPYYNDPSQPQTPTGHDGVMVFKDHMSPEAQALVDFVASPELQAMFITHGRFPTRYNIEPLASMPDNYYRLKNTLEENGPFDLGLGRKEYSEIRNIWTAVLQGMFTNELSPEEAVRMYAEEAREILGQ